MTGKKWFYWLGRLHGSRKQIKVLDRSFPMWAHNAYESGFVVGWNEVCQ